MLAPTLILGGTIRVVTAIARSLHRAGITVDVASLRSSHPPRTLSNAIRNHFDLPDYRESPGDFIRSLMRLIERHRFDMLIPSTDSALVAISPHYDVLSRLTHVGCPPPEIVRRVLDKRLTLDAGRECGLDTPRVFDPWNGSQPDGTPHGPRLPVVAKPADKFREQEVAVQHFYDLQRLRSLLLQDPDLESACLLQEFCEGEGVGVTVLLWDGEPRAIFQHRRLKELPSYGGVSTLAEAQRPDPVLVEQSVTLLRHLEWQGTAMVEFRKNRDTGSATLMEVNGRYWGSLPLAIRAGMNFPLYEWQLAHGLKPDVPECYAEGLKLLWRAGDAGRLAGLVRYYLKGALDFRALLHESVRFWKDFLSPTPDAVWSVRDPLPAFAELYARIMNARRAAPAGPVDLGKQVLSHKGKGF